MRTAFVLILFLLAGPAMAQTVFTQSSERDQTIDAIDVLIESLRISQNNILDELRRSVQSSRNCTQTRQQRLEHYLWDDNHPHSKTLLDHTDAVPPLISPDEIESIRHTEQELIGAAVREDNRVFRGVCWRGGCRQ